MAFVEFVRFSDIEHHCFVAIHFGDGYQRGDGFVTVKRVGYQILNQQENNAYQRKRKQVVVGNKLYILIHRRVLGLISGKLGFAKNRAHHLDQMNHAFIVNKVKNAVGVFFKVQNTFIS